MDKHNSSGLEPCSSHISRELEQMMSQAMAIGPQTGEYMSRLIRNVGFKEQMLGACRGILRLARVRGKARIEAACSRGLQGSKYNLKVIKNILDNNLDGQPLTDPHTSSRTQTKAHDHLRGDQFFT